MDPSQMDDVIVKKEIGYQETKFVNQLLLPTKYVKPEPIDTSVPTTSTQRYLMPVKIIKHTGAIRRVPTAPMKVHPAVHPVAPRKSFLFPVKRTHTAAPVIVKPSPVVPKQGNFRMRLMPTVVVNIKRTANPGNEASGSAEKIMPAKRTPEKEKSVEELLKELDKEYEEECGKKVKLEWLSGNYPLRKECLKLFEENAHPSPREVLEIATRFNASYRMVYDNFHRIRVHHEVPCKPGDNCRRIQNYFQAVAPRRGYFRLNAEQRNVLEVEMFKMFKQSLTLSVGQMHVLADLTGLPPYVVRSQSFALRKRFLVSSDPDGSVKNKAELKREFDVDPFPDPKIYQIFATRLDIRYDDVQRFYNSARLNHVEKHGQYEKVHEQLSDRTAEALWKVAREGKQLGLERRKELAKSLAVPYLTIAFWLDNYMSQLRWGVNTYRVNVSDDECQEEDEEERKDKEEIPVKTEEDITVKTEEDITVKTEVVEE